jgi:hypothetical protein
LQVKNTPRKESIPQVPPFKEGSLSEARRLAEYVSQNIERWAVSAGNELEGCISGECPKNDLALIAVAQ